MSYLASYFFVLIDFDSNIAWTNCGERVDSNNAWINLSARARARRQRRNDNNHVQAVVQYSVDCDAESRIVLPRLTSEPAKLARSGK